MGRCTIDGVRSGWALNLFQEAHGVALRFDKDDMIAASAVGAALVNTLIVEISEAEQWLRAKSTVEPGRETVLPAGSNWPDLLQIVSACVSVGLLPERDELLWSQKLVGRHEHSGQRLS